jgi:hypothetical protein
VAIRHRADEVDYLTPLHPLVHAIAADARRRLVHVYPSARGLPPRRLAARLVRPDEPASALFTFLGCVSGSGGFVEERIIGIRVSAAGEPVGAPDEALRILDESTPSGEVGVEVLKGLFAVHFDAMRSRATEDAQRWLRAHAEELRGRRAEQAALLRRDLERDVADRLGEIDEEEKRARGLIDAGGQQRLFADADVPVTAFAARRAAVNADAERRREEIAQFARIDEPPQPQPLGALFLVPGGSPR